MHENASQVQLDLEADVDVGPVDGRAPPQGEPPVGNLVQTRSLGVGQLFVLHRLFEAGGLFPKQAFPGGKVSALEQSMLQDT